MEGGNFFTDLLRATVPGQAMQRSRERRAEFEARQAQRTALREEFGDRSGGNAEDVARLEDVDTARAERRRGAQLAGLPLISQILAAPQEQQQALAERYAPVLSNAYGIQPEEFFQVLDAISSSGDPAGAIEALRSGLTDPAMGQLIGLPNMIDPETGRAIGVTRGGREVHFSGRPTSSYNVQLQDEGATRRKREGAPGEGAVTIVDPETDRPTGVQILPGSGRDPNYLEEAEFRRRTGYNRATFEATLTERTAGANELAGTLEGIVGAYGQLFERGMTIDPTTSAARRGLVQLRTSEWFAPIGRVLDPSTQEQLDFIAGQSSAALSGIRRAYGMGSREVDTPRELEFYLQQLGAPNRSVVSNLAAIDALDRRVGAARYGAAPLLDRIELPEGLRTQVRAQANNWLRQHPLNPRMYPVDEEGNRLPGEDGEPAPAAPSRRNPNASLDEIRRDLRGE